MNIKPLVKDTPDQKYITYHTKSFKLQFQPNTKFSMALKREIKNMVHEHYLTYYTLRVLFGSAQKLSRKNFCSKKKRKRPSVKTNGTTPSKENAFT